jgi:hypothetical protein
LFAQLLDAVGHCPIPALDELVQKQAYGAWARALITDEELQALCEAAQSRRSERRVFAKAREEIATRAAALVRQLRPRTRLHLSRSAPAVQRRRRTVSSGAMPPQVAALFSEAERAAMSVVAHAVRRSGVC